MSSFPPVGGTTRRSLFAVWTAAIVSFANRRVIRSTHFANRTPVFNVIVGGCRRPLSSSANRHPVWQATEFGNCASAAALLQAAT